MYYSQFQQDEAVYKTFFQFKFEGYFVDIGAHNGIEFSNSKYFEDLGWQGICIEPNPTVFKELQASRKCECVQKAVADRTGKAEFMQLPVADMLSGLVDDLNDRALANIKQNIGDAEPTIIEVELDTFDNLVTQTDIDYLSLDTEGNEMKILESIDFNKYNIKVMSIENNEYDNRFYNYLTSRGYTALGRLGCDEIYYKNGLQLFKTN
jgi:FkbM family methyltransferase